MNDGTNSFCFDYAPYKERQPGDGGDRSFDSEEVTAAQELKALRLESEGNIHIWWIGNQIAGKEIKENKKKHIKSAVSIPADDGSEFAAKVMSVGDIQEWSSAYECD
jgi:hypothetical protein